MFSLKLIPEFKEEGERTRENGRPAGKENMERTAGKENMERTAGKENMERTAGKEKR